MDASTNNGLLDSLQDWWSFGVFIVSIVAGWLLGYARKAWTIEEQQKKLIELEAEINNIRQSIGQNDIDSAVLKNELEHIQESLMEVKAVLQIFVKHTTKGE